jgi:hypothetical protein
MCILVKRKTKKNEFEIIHAQKNKRMQIRFFSTKRAIDKKTKVKAFVCK